MEFRLVIEFAKPAGSGDWMTVAAPVFTTGATEEEVYAAVRKLIESLPPGTRVRNHPVQDRPAGI